MLKALAATGWQRIGLAFGLGVLAAAGQAPVGWWWLAVPAFAGVIRLVARANDVRTASLLALFAGAGHFAAALSWIVEPFLIDVARHGWMAPFAVVLLAFGLALFWAAAGALSRFARSPALGFAVALAATELARGYVLTGFPWATPGHIWVDTPVAQIAALIGPSGLTLVTLLAAALVATARPDGAAAGAVVLALAAGFGLWRLNLPEPAPTGLTLRLVQPNAAQEAKWDPSNARVFFERQLAYTAVRPLPDLTIWPETAVPYLLETSPEVAFVIADAAQGVPVALGVQRVEGQQYWNSLRVIAPDGQVSATYDKHHLVPFGEYVPLADLALDWFGIGAFAAQAGNGYSAGVGPVLLDLGPLGQVLPLICYEAVFPQIARELESRPDWMLQITNDAWFGTLTGPYQHLAQAQLRAIEQGVPLARAANTGISAMIDARGRITASLPLGQAGYVDVALPGALPQPIYARFGEWPLLVLLAGAGAGLFRSKRQGSA